MSIWDSLPHIGFGKLDDEARPAGGQVRSYATGWSNHYPDTDVEQPACVDLASIPPWCVPGHAEEFDDVTRGPWLRLGVTTWEHKYATPTEVTRRVDASVVMDEAAVKALVKELRHWLKQPKAYPR